MLGGAGLADGAAVPVGAALRGGGDRPGDASGRVRVTLEPTAVIPTAGGSAAAAQEADAVFAQSLVRTQLRLALGSLLGFLLVAGAFTVVILTLASSDEPIIFGVPLSWLLQAYGYYPIILFFAVVYARGATRNERRYRALLETERES